MSIFEIAVVVVCGLIFSVLFGPEFAYSIVLGGMAFIVPNIIFVRFSLGTAETDSSRNMLTHFYIGEAIKIVATIVMFAFSILVIKPVSIGLVFVGYACISLMNLLGLALLMNKNG